MKKTTIVLLTLCCIVLSLILSACNVSDSELSSGGTDATGTTAPTHQTETKDTPGSSGIMSANETQASTTTPTTDWDEPVSTTGVEESTRVPETTGTTVPDTTASQTEPETTKKPENAKPAGTEESETTPSQSTAKPTETKPAETVPPETKPPETTSVPTDPKPPVPETTAPPVTETDSEPEKGFTQADHDRIIAEVRAYAESYAAKGYTFIWKEDMEFSWEVGYMGTPRIGRDGVDGVIRTLKYHIDLIVQTTTDPANGITCDHMTYRVMQIDLDGEIAFVAVYGG